MGARLDQRERRQGLARDEPFVTELDQPVADVGGIEAEVFGVEALAAAPVTDGGGAEDTAPADGFEEG
jgi:hypothetical protein